MTIGEIRGRFTSLKIGYLLCVVVGLLEGIGDGEHVSFAEGFADDLQADGQTAFGEAAGDRDRWQPGEVDRDSVNVAEIHGEGIITTLTALEGWCR